MTTVHEDTSIPVAHGRGSPRRTALLRLLPVVAVTVVALGDGSSRTASGLREAGPFITWMVPSTRVWLDVAAFATVGTLLTAWWLLPGTTVALRRTRLRVLRLSGHWSLVWATAALCHGIVSTAQLVGAGAREVLTTPALYPLLWRVPQSRAVLGMALAGLVIHLCCARAREPRMAGPLLVGALSSMIPLLVTGHASASSHHYLASQSVVVHVLSASLWVGGLTAVVLHLRSDPVSLRVALPRFSTLAAWCYLALGLSGLVGAWVRLDPSWAVAQSTFGVIVVTKAGVLLALGLLGTAHRSWTLPQVAAGRRLAFVRFAVVELALMATATGLAVALARTPPPGGALSHSPAAHTSTASTMVRGLDPVGPHTLLLGFRPDVVVVTVVAVVLVAYLGAVARLLRAGGTWQTRSSVSFVGAVLLATWCLCGGLGAYSGALLSVEVARLLTMGLVVPALLTAGAPLVLARTCGAGAAAVRLTARLSRFTDPVNALIVLVGVLAAALTTPLLDTSLRSPTAHLALPVLAMAAGLLLVRSLQVVERPPRRPRAAGSVPLPAAVVGVLGVLLLVYAVHVGTSDTLYAAEWYTSLGISWSDPLTDQRRAAIVAGCFGLAVLVAAPWIARWLDPGSRVPEQT